MINRLANVSLVAAHNANAEFQTSFAYLADSLSFNSDRLSHRIRAAMSPVLSGAVPYQHPNRGHGRGVKGRLLLQEEGEDPPHKVPPRNRELVLLAQLHRLSLRLHRLCLLPQGPQRERGRRADLAVSLQLR